MDASTCDLAVNSVTFTSEDATDKEEERECPQLADGDEDYADPHDEAQNLGLAVLYRKITLPVAKHIGLIQRDEANQAKLQRAELDRLARAAWQGVHTVAKGLAFIAATADLASHAPAMQKAAVATFVTRVVRMILLDTLWAMDSSNVNTFPMLTNEAEDAVALPIKKLREALPKVASTLASSDDAILATKCATVAEAVAHLEKMSSNGEMGLVLRPPDRKDEKRSLAAMGDALRVEVSDAKPTTVEDLATALVRLTALAFYKSCKVVVVIPGNSVAAFATYLKDPALSQLQAAVTGLLIGGEKTKADVRAVGTTYDAVRTAVLLESTE